MFPDVAHAPLLRPIPAVPGWEHSLRFLADPYRFIARECRRLGSDVVQARLLLQPTLCLTGPHAAALFGDPTRMRPDGDGLEPIRGTFLGMSAAHAAGRPEHLQPVRFLNAACGPVPTAALLEEARRQWNLLMPQWGARPRVVLYEAAQHWMARTACAWAGLPLPEGDAGWRMAQLAALVDGPATGGLSAHLRARRARRGAENWLADLVRSHRSGSAGLPVHSPAAAAAVLHDVQGRLLPARLACAELLNLVRPILAVAVFIVLAAHALHEHPGWRVALQGGREADIEAFVQEVRRFYPYFPAVGAQACREFVWEGWHFPDGVRVMLDLYGTNHDARAWPQPNEFRPERFMGAIPGLFEVTPLGGGRTGDRRRGASEGSSMALMKLAVRQLVSHARYEVPAQDLRLQMDRLPALPRDRFILQRLRPA